MDRRLYATGHDTFSSKTSEPAPVRSAYEVKPLSKAERRNIQEAFKVGSVMEYMKHEAMKEMQHMAVRSGSCSILSIGQVTVPERERQQDYLVVRGQSNLINFIDPDTMSIERSIELQQHWGGNNLRWIIQINDYFILQLHNKYGDILIYKGDEFKRSEQANDFYLKPLLFTTKEHPLTTALFVGESGTLTLS